MGGEQQQGDLVELNEASGQDHRPEPAHRYGCAHVRLQPTAESDPEVGLLSTMHEQLKARDAGLREARPLLSVIVRQRSAVVGVFQHERAERRQAKSSYSNVSEIPRRAAERNIFCNVQ